VFLGESRAPLPTLVDTSATLRHFCVVNELFIIIDEWLVNHQWSPSPQSEQMGQSDRELPLGAFSERASASEISER